MSLANIFSELVEAIENYGCNLKLPAQIRSVIDRHDMLVIDRSDGDSTEVDFGMRHGFEYIVAHFLVYSQEASTHVAYDIDWHCGPVDPGVPEIEKRSWNWDIPVETAANDDEPTLFSILQ